MQKIHAKSKSAEVEDETQTAKDEGSELYAVANILDWDPDAGYLVMWETDPATTSFVQPMSLMECVPFVLAFHKGDWTAVPDCMRDAARKLANPNAMVVEDVTPLERECQETLKAHIDESASVLPNAVVRSMSCVEISEIVTGHLEALAAAAAGAVTSPDYFLRINDMVSPSNTIEATEIGSYFTHVLQPLAPEGWTFADPIVFFWLSQGHVPQYRSQTLPRVPGTVLLLPCFHPSMVPDGVGHWTLLVFQWVHGSRMRVVLFDSMGGALRESHKDAIECYAASLRDLLHVPDGARPLPSEAQRVIRNAVQLPSLTDCGVWVMAIARGLLGGEVPPVPKRGQIPFLRALIAAELLLRVRLPRACSIASSSERIPLIPVAETGEVCESHSSPTLLTIYSSGEIPTSASCAASTTTCSPCCCHVSTSHPSVSKPDPNTKVAPN